MRCYGSLAGEEQRQATTMDNRACAKPSLAPVWLGRLLVQAGPPVLRPHRWVRSTLFPSLFCIQDASWYLYKQPAIHEFANPQQNPPATLIPDFSYHSSTQTRPTRRPTPGQDFKVHPKFSHLLLEFDLVLCCAFFGALSAPVVAPEEVSVFSVRMYPDLGRIRCKHSLPSRRKALMFELEAFLTFPSNKLKIILSDVLFELTYVIHV